jgi:ketosteroid isomerase-like protein
MTDLKNIESKLVEVVDRDEIRDLMLRYARGVNRQDWELVLSCYHHDAVENHLPFWGPGSPQGFVDWMQAEFKAYQQVQTFVGNQLIEVYGDLAWGEAYGMNVHRKVEPDGRVFHLTGFARYNIRYERRAGHWRFAEREFLTDAGSFDAVGGFPIASSDGSTSFIQIEPTGQFGPTDSSYGVRRRIRTQAGL